MLGGLVLWLFKNRNVALKGFVWCNFEDLQGCFKNVALKKIVSVRDGKFSGFPNLDISERWRHSEN